MEKDTTTYDTLKNRPLPKWLRDQKEGLNTIQPQKIVMKDDHSLSIAFTATAIFILLIVALLSVYILTKNKNK
jgi:hypothetical protein